MGSLSDFQKQFDYISELKSSLNAEKPKIFCIGMQNAGKSSLLNALIDDFENKTFSVSDIRETANTKEIQYKNIIYVDTPGIGHSQKDNNTVFDSIINSDMNLFVHNTEGELLEEEVSFLKKIQNGWKNSKEFIDKTIFIISRADLVEPKEIDRLKNRVFVQIEEIFGAKPKIISTSSNDYIQGKTEDELELVKISNILELREYIYENKKDIQKNRKYKINSMIKQLIKEINIGLRDFDSEIYNLYNEINTKQKNLFEEKIKIEINIENTFNRLQNKNTFDIEYREHELNHYKKSIKTIQENWNIYSFKAVDEFNAEQISEYKKKISEINYEIEKQLAKNNEIEKNNNIILKEIETLKTEAISLFKEKYNETIKFDITYSINKDYKSLDKAKINLSLDSIKELENKLINLKRHRKKLFELKLLTRNLYI